jgi:hypothetical protein
MPVSLSIVVSQTPTISALGSSVSICKLGIPSISGEKLPFIATIFSLYSV